MTKKLRVVRALVDARTRMRDLAAAAHTSATATRDLAAQTLSDEEEALETHLDGAAETLSAVTSVYDIDRVTAVAHAYRFAVVDAGQRHAEASAASDAAAKKLNDRTRQLRTAEKLKEIIQEHRSKHEARNEQRAIDDLAARKRS